MRILYVVNSTRTVGGATKSFLTLLFGMAENGIEPFVVTPDKGDLYQMLKDKGIGTLAVSYRMNIYPNCSTLKDFILFLPRVIARRYLEHKAISKIADFCIKNRIDLIHTNVSVVSCGMSAAKRIGIPHVLHVREYADKDFSFRHYPTKRCYNRKISGTNTVCITREIQKYHCLENACSKVIYDGVEVDGFNGHSEFCNERFFLFAGRIEVSKDPMQVVVAYNAFRLQNPDVKVSLKLAGPISEVAYWKRIQSYVKENHLEGCVEYIGVREDLDNLMHDAVAVIVSSVCEGFGRCLPEAMLNDCLTIGRDTGGTKEQYDNGLRECGEEIGFRYQTTNELTEQMSRVALASEHAFDKIKSNAKMVVQKLYTKEANINSIKSFYQEILSSAK